MIVTRTALIAPSGRPGSLNESLAGDLLWLHVKPHHQVEHLRVQAEPGGFHVIWFILAPDEEQARQRAVSVCLDTIAAAGALQNWRVA